MIGNWGRHGFGRRLDGLHRLAISLPGVAFVAEQELDRFRHQRPIAQHGVAPRHLIERNHDLVPERLQPIDLHQRQVEPERDGIRRLGAINQGPGRSPLDRDPEQVERLGAFRFRPILAPFEHRGKHEPGFDQQRNARERRLQFAGTPGPGRA